MGARLRFRAEYDFTLLELMLVIAGGSAFTLTATHQECGAGMCTF
jgi:hypothetical protein